MATQFPKVIHVTTEELGNGEVDYLVHVGGVHKSNVNEHWTPVAEYRLVETGHISVFRQFTISPRRSRK